jgi:hypothetical protein
MLERLKAPVIINAVNAADTGSVPALLFDGTGTAVVFMQSSSFISARMGVVFGAGPDMPVATASNAFPVPFSGIRWKLGPSTRYVSAICLDGVEGDVVYYFEGQTDVTT